MKVVTIVGARPQFIKAAPVSRAIRSLNNSLGREEIAEIIVHTGQHYDDNMSDIFFAELDIPRPRYNLEVGSGSHAAQTGLMLQRIEEVLNRETPGLVMVYGDTNSTLAGALVAAKLRIRIAHVEAGLRSYNRGMPEEINRVVTDHLSNLLFCPTPASVSNLALEGIKRGVHLVGDVMYDSVLNNTSIAEERSRILRELELERGEYVLVTVHRAENTDSTERLRSIIYGLNEVALSGTRVVVPLHPRTRKQISALELSVEGLQCIEPVSYLDMLLLQKNARFVVTDSGGVQKESFFLKVPCVTLRDETEWMETVESGWNILVGADPEKLVQAIRSTERVARNEWPCFGDGHASEHLVAVLRDEF